MFELFICGSRGISSEVKTFGKLSAESAEKTFAKKSDGGIFSLHFFIFYVFFSKFLLTKCSTKSRISRYMSINVIEKGEKVDSSYGGKVKR